MFESQLQKESQIKEAAKFTWQQSHSSKKVLRIYSGHLQSLAASKPNECTTSVQGLEFTDSLARFTSEAQGLEHAQLFFGSISLLTKHNQTAEFRAIALAYLAADFGAKGLKAEARILAGIIQATSAGVLLQRPAIRELVYETLRG